MLRQSSKAALDAETHVSVSGERAEAAEVAKELVPTVAAAEFF